jgi:hypothetical protein
LDIVEEGHIDRIFQMDPKHPASFSQDIENPALLYENIIATSDHSADPNAYSYIDVIALFHDKASDVVTPQDVQDFFKENPTPLHLYNKLPDLYAVAEERIGFDVARKVVPSLIEEFILGLYGESQLAIAKTVIDVLKDARTYLENEGNVSITESTKKALNKRNRFSFLRSFWRKKAINLPSYKVNILQTFGNVLDDPLDNKIPRGNIPYPDDLKIMVRKREEQKRLAA